MLFPFLLLTHTKIFVSTILAAVTVGVVHIFNFYIFTRTRTFNHNTVLYKEPGPNLSPGSGYVKNKN